MKCRQIASGAVTAFVAQTGRCSSCAKETEFACDYPLRGKAAGRTCDRLLCADHRRPQADGVDYCAAHARASAQGKLPGTA